VTGITDNSNTDYIDTSTGVFQTDGVNYRFLASNDFFDISSTAMFTVSPLTGIFSSVEGTLDASVQTIGVGSDVAILAGSKPDSTTLKSNPYSYANFIECSFIMIFGVLYLIIA